MNTNLCRSAMLYFVVGFLFAVVRPLTSATKVTSWPEGQYGLPKSVDGCPKSTSVTWETGMLFQDCEDTYPKTSKSPSYHLAGFVNNDVQQEFCIKTKNESASPPWPAGQYCVYQKGDECPRGLESGWVIWDDESEVIGGNKNARNGTLPKGIYDKNTKIYFCCRTTGSKTVPIDLPLATPFYLIAYGNNVCQRVRGAQATREFIYYETEHNTRSTNNDYGGAHPYRVLRSRYGHTIYYCYYTPNYCHPLYNVNNGYLYPSRCLQTNSNTFNDTCTARCNPGFVPRDVQVSICGEDGRWDSTPMATCTPATTTTNPASLKTELPPKHPFTSNNSIKSNTSGPLQQTTQRNTATPTTRELNPSSAIHPSSGESTRDQNPEFNTQAASGEDAGLSSVGRIVAGAISGAVVLSGVLFLICLSYCRLTSKKKQRKRKSALDKSKSLEELVAGRTIMQRTRSVENLVYADPNNCQVEYIAQTDENPLYERFECFPPNAPERETGNVLYESVSPLLPSYRTMDKNESPPYNYVYQPTTL